MFTSYIRTSFCNAQQDEVGVALPWLLILRWGEVFCQIVLIIGVWLEMDTEIPILPVSLIILFEGASNLYLHSRHRRNVPVSNLMIPFILLMDTLALTGLLYVTGGARNPFVFLYLIHIVTGAIILQEKCSWLITAVTLTCYILLLYLPPPFITPLTAFHVANNALINQEIDGLVASVRLHMKGMSGAFFLTCIFIVFFVSKIQKALAEQQAMLQALSQERERNQRLASLATLTAGAAHELATPLSTVAVVSCEMIRTLKECKCGYSAELLDDAHLVRKQVADCKEIIYQMNAGAGKHMGEEIRKFSVQQIVNRIFKEIDKDQLKRVRVTIEPKDLTITMPFRSLCRTVKGLLKNGLEASRSPQKVFMRWFTTSDHLGVEILDEGIGIEESIESKVTEPFFTTKKSGLGLGLFLAKNMAEQFGGDLTIQRPEGHGGARVVLTFALDMIGIQDGNGEDGE